MFSLDLPQQTTIITGATGGLGVALVQAILYAGSDAFCIDIHSQPPTEAWSVITAHATTSGVVATYFKCDVTREDEVDAALRKCAQIARERQRPVRGMVSAAGVQQTYDAFDFPESEFRRIMDVNVTGSFLVAKHVARLVKDTGLHGSIVLIASISGYIANRDVHGVAYCASKAAVQSLCRALAAEWGRHGIRINSLSPGPIMTNMVSALLEESDAIRDSFMASSMLGRLGVPDDVGAAAVYFLSEKSAYVTGADLKLDGGACATT